MDSSDPLGDLVLIVAALFADAGNTLPYSLIILGPNSANSTSINDGTYNVYPAGANNGVRSGANWGQGEGWNDNTPGSFPDWLQIEFAGNQTIDEINVFAPQDNWQSPVEPTATMTFSQLGLSGFDVQYWNGSSWVTVPGGSVTGNNLVWRKFTFAAVTTSKIRVLTNASASGWSRLTEVEAWTAASGSSSSSEVLWLVADHLGTPRMILDETGWLTNVKRHDYLPFGEELFAGSGGRTTAQGYTTSDNVRQKFTSKERDNETALDNFGARYYASTQARFTSPDPLLSSGDVEVPQSWNRYSYTLNNPLVYTDPLGLYVFDKSVDEEQQKKFNAAIDQARENLKTIGQKYGTESKEYKAAARALDVYGQKGVDNGVIIVAKNGAGDGRTEVDGIAGRKTADNPTGQRIQVGFDLKSFDSAAFSQLIGHEGSHAADGAQWVASGFSEAQRPTLYQGEVNAYTVQSLLIEAQYPNKTGRDFFLPGASAGRGRNPIIPELIILYSSAWAEADKATLRRTNINSFLARPKNQGGSYGLTPASQQKAWRKGYKYP